MKRYWEGMSNPVTLRLPNKTEWKVEWKKDDGDIWLCNNGWKEFAEYVCLSNKLQFVVFQYEGNSCFNVIVLAKNGLEIKYKEARDINTTTRTAAEEEKEVDESDCSVKVLDVLPSSSAKRPKSAPQSSQPHKKRKTNPKDQIESHLSKLQFSQHQHHKKKKKTRNGKEKAEAHSSFDNAKHLSSGSFSSFILHAHFLSFVLFLKHCYFYVIQINYSKFVEAL